MKKVLIYTICIVLSIIAGGVASAGKIDKIYVSDVSGNTGDVKTVPVNVSNMDNIGSIQLDITYDKNVIVVNNVTVGDIDSGSLFQSNIDNNTGRVTVGVVSTEGISGTGTIASVDFKVIGNIGTASPLNINITDITDPVNNPVGVPITTGAEFYVGNAPAPSPTILDGGDERIRSSSRGSLNAIPAQTTTSTTVGNTIPTTVGTTTQTATSTVVETPVQAKIPDENTSPEGIVTSTKTEKSPGFGIVASIIVLSMTYILGRKKR